MHGGPHGGAAHRSGARVGSGSHHAGSYRGPLQNRLEGVIRAGPRGGHGVVAECRQPGSLGGFWRLSPESFGAPDALLPSACLANGKSLGCVLCRDCPQHSLLSSASAATGSRLLCTPCNDIEGDALSASESADGRMPLPGRCSRSLSSSTSLAQISGDGDVDRRRLPGRQPSSCSRPTSLTISGWRAKSRVALA